MTPITIDTTVLHPWAENPQTIGALAISQLGIYCSRKEVRTEKLVEEILRCGALESLLQCLTDSQQRDRKEAALLLLSFISEDCERHTAKAISQRLLQLNALSVFLAQLKDTKEGVICTALFCCRNLYLSHPAVQRAFIAAQGCTALCNLLTSHDNLTVYETLLNILDLLLVLSIQDDTDRVQDWARTAVLNAHLLDRLEDVLSVETR